MVYSCSVFGCTNRGNTNSEGKKISYHRFPVVIENQGEKTRELSSRRRLAWIASLKRKGWEPSEYSRVCSEHFVDGNPSKLYEETSPSWIPSLKLGWAADVPDSGRYGRAEKRQRRKLDSDAAAVVEELQEEPVEERISSVVMVDVACETDDFSWLMDKAEEVHMLQKEIDQLKEDKRHLEAEVADLKKKLQGVSLSAEGLESDENKLKFYTGITEWCTFSALFELIACHLPESYRLTKLSMLLMFFLKIRLNLFDEDIGYRFDVHASTVSRNFHRVLDIMFVKTAPLIKWPDRDVLRQTKPMSFRKFFKKCCVIIDCTEVFIERPIDLLARAQVWSNYKHHSTVKFLIGITPQGTISFLSHCVGGRMSDKEITEQSGLLQHLLPGDVVLADRGFTVDEYARMAMAEVKIPPFTKGKKQLEKIEVDWSRELSLVRIHVERVIGVLKQKYTILQGTLALKLIQHENEEPSTIDKIVTVCCACVNMCPSVILQE